MNERSENRQFEFPTVPKLFAAGRTQKRANTEERACHGSEKDIPLPADKITDINKKLSQRGKFSAKISENFTEDRDNSHDQESGDGKRDADHDDRIGHGRFDFLAQTRARFEESGQAIQNFGEQTSMLARFDHADKEPIENEGMFGERFMECFATLHPRCDIADHGPQRSLPSRISLFVQSGQSLHQRNTRLDHGRKLPGKENKIGLFYFSGFLTRVSGRRFTLQRKHHQAAAHQAGHSVVFVEGFLNARHDASGSVTCLIGECDHKKVIMKIVAVTVPTLSAISAGKRTTNDSNVAAYA